MTLRFVKVFALTLLSCFYYACKCDNGVCPALEAQYAAWLPYKTNDIITYANDKGQEIQFTISRYALSEPKEQHCGPDGYGGCHCAECPDPSSEVFGETADTSRQILNALGQSTGTLNNTLYIYVNQPENKKDSVFLTYLICDHGNTMPIGPAVVINKKDSLLPSFIAGNRTYSEVITHEVDTTVMRYANPIYNVYYVWKSWYNKEYGIIAFYDLKTRSFFYRKW